MKYLLGLLVVIFCADVSARSAAVRTEFVSKNPCPGGVCNGWEVDHVIPLACGGADSVENLQWLTIAENRSKGSWGCLYGDTARNREILQRKGYIAQTDGAIVRTRPKAAKSPNLVRARSQASWYASAPEHVMKPVGRGIARNVATTAGLARSAAAMAACATATGGTCLLVAAGTVVVVEAGSYLFFEYTDLGNEISAKANGAFWKVYNKASSYIP